MTKREFKEIEKTYGINVAKAIEKLEKELEIFFVEKNNYKKTEYKKIYKLYVAEFFELIPFVVAKVSTKLMNEQTELLLKSLNKKK